MIQEICFGTAPGQAPVEQPSQSSLFRPLNHALKLSKVFWTIDGFLSMLLSYQA
jgi:hypothetical protein